MTTERTIPPGSRDFAPALWGAQMFVAAVASFYIFLQRMGVAGCSSQCDFGLIRLAADGFLVTALALLAATGALLLILPRRRRGRALSRDAWIPVLGIVLTVSCAVVASKLISAAIAIN